MGVFNGKKLFHNVTIMDDSIHFDRDCCRILVAAGSKNFTIGISEFSRTQHGAYVRFIETKKNPETTIAMRHVPYVNLANRHPNDGAIKAIVHFGEGKKFFMDDNSFNILKMPKDFTPDVFKPIQFNAFPICFGAGNNAKNDAGTFKTRIFNMCGEEMIVWGGHNNILSNVSKIFYARETDTTQASLLMKNTLNNEEIPLMHIYSIMLTFQTNKPSAGAYFRILNPNKAGQPCLKDEEGNDLCVSSQKTIIVNFTRLPEKQFLASTVNISHIADDQAVFNRMGLMNTCPAANRIQYPFKFTLEYIHARIPATDSKGTFLKKSYQGYTDAYMKYIYL